MKIDRLFLILKEIVLVYYISNNKEGIIYCITIKYIQNKLLRIKKIQVHDHLYRNRARICKYEDFRTYQLNSPYFSVTNYFCNIKSIIKNKCN